jgi:hypothetical protein
MPSGEAPVFDAAAAVGAPAQIAGGQPVAAPPVAGEAYGPEAGAMSPAAPGGYPAAPAGGYPVAPQIQGGSVAPLPSQTPTLSPPKRKTGLVVAIVVGVIVMLAVAIVALWYAIK